MTTIETSSGNLRQTWTTERVAQLKSGVNAGLSCAQIANEIGVSRNAVIGKINRLGLSRGRSPAAPRPCRGALIRRPQVLNQRLKLKALFASAPIADDVVSSEPCSLLNLAPRKCRWPISGINAVGSDVLPKIIEVWRRIGSEGGVDDLRPRCTKCTKLS